MYDYGVVIGRFQPFHNSHWELIDIALEKSKKVIIVLGSCNTASTVKNPWTGKQREEMIRDSFEPGDSERLVFIHARDYLYNDTLWYTAIQEQVFSVVDDTTSVALFGHNKDDSSYYLKYFPQWTYVDVGRLSDIDATKVRDLFFQQDVIGVRHLVPESVSDFLERFQKTEQFQNLHEEQLHYRDYIAKTRFVGVPWKPTFVTVDAVVTCSSHVLIVRRKLNPGKNLLALPGGFLDGSERIIDGAIRELREETGIKIAKNDLHDMIVAEKVFDHPGRSLRGRTITHAFHIDLSRRFSKLPPVKGGDDASKAFWMPLLDVFANEAAFFDDHAHIVRFFALKI